VTVAPKRRDAESDGTSHGELGIDGPRLSAKPRRLVLGSDARETFLVGLSALTALVRPVDRWAAVTDQFYRLNRGKSSSRYGDFRRRVAAFFGADADEAFVADLWRAWHNFHHRRRMLIVAKKVRKNYSPDIHFVGRDRLEAGLEAGAGVILWFDNFIHHSVVGKLPFAEAGFVSWQLSSADHGFSRSTLGRRLLNPIQHSVESGLVAKRIVFDGTTALAATREVKSLLAGNRIVRITNNAFIGRRFVRVPFGAAAWLSVATTPLNLARSTGAALLPVSVVEKVPFDRYDVAIGAPVVVGTGSKSIALRSAALDYARYLEPLVRAHPEQWITWSGTIDQAPGE